MFALANSLHFYSRWSAALAEQTLLHDNDIVFAIVMFVDMDSGHHRACGERNRDVAEHAVHVELLLHGHGATPVSYLRIIIL